MKLTVAHDLLPKTPSLNTSVVMDQFGIDFETGRHVVAEGLELPLEARDVVLFTGPSGSGKSSLMRAAVRELEGVVDADDLELGSRTLVDALDRPVVESIRLLASCGLGEPRLLLRTPRELSDGQRYRFRLALALSRAPTWVVADEFTATLDRTLARVVAFNVRRIAARTGTGFLLATTHEDVTSDLAPDLHVHLDLDGAISCNRPRDERSNAASSDSPTTSNSRPARDATGRTSLGGIIAATASDSCGS